MFFLYLYLDKVLCKAPASFPRQLFDFYASTVCGCGLAPERKSKMTATGHHSQRSITKPTTETSFKRIVRLGKNEPCAPGNSSCHGFNAQGSYSFSRSDIFTVRKLREGWSRKPVLSPDLALGPCFCQPGLISNLG